MKIMYFTKSFTLFIILISVTSCSQISTNKQESQIRFVDLQGNSRNIRLSTPSENTKALTKQGKISRVKVLQEKNYQKVAPQALPLSYNKYGENNKEQLDQPKKPVKNSSLLYTMNLPTEENNQKGIKKPTLKKSQDNEQEYKLTKKPVRVQNASTYSRPRVISETKFPAKESDKNHSNSSKLQGGTYVQVGSFTVMDHAKKHLNKIQKLTNNLKNINIQSAKVKKRNYYRPEVFRRDFWGTYSNSY